MPMPKKLQQQKTLHSAIKEAGSVYEFKKALARFVRQYRLDRMREVDYERPQPELLKAFRDGRNDLAELVLAHLETKEK